MKLMEVLRMPPISRDVFFLMKCLFMSILVCTVIVISLTPSKARAQTGSNGNDTNEPENQVVLAMDAANYGSADLALFYLLTQRWFPNPAKDPGYRGAAGTDRFRLETRDSTELWLVPVEAFDPDDGTVSLGWNIWSDDLLSINGTTTEEYSPVSGSSGNLQMQQYTIQTHDLLLGFQNLHMQSPKQLDPIVPDRDVRIGLIMGDTVQFNAMLFPDSMTLEDDEYDWSGFQSGTGETITMTFNSSGTYSEHLRARNSAQRTGRITVMEVPDTTQLEWGLTHPIQALTAKALRDEAEAWMAANIGVLGVDVRNGGADAARHAYWSAIMTIDWNAADAEGLATAHERDGLNLGAPHNETVMDLENNAVGRTIGAGSTQTRDAVENAVISALQAGTLTILDDILNTEERGLLQSSNQ
jgi:hypothetical protein